MGPFWSQQILEMKLLPRWGSTAGENKPSNTEMQNISQELEDLPAWRAFRPTGN